MIGINLFKMWTLGQRVIQITFLETVSGKLLTVLPFKCRRLLQPLWFAERSPPVRDLRDYVPYGFCVVASKEARKATANEHCETGAVLMKSADKTLRACVNFC